MGTYRVPVEDHLFLPSVVRLSAGPAHFVQQSGEAVPSPVTIRLLIDTGSRRTTLIPSIIRHLGPPAGGEARVITPTGAVAAPLYWVRLDFPETGLASFDQVKVACLPLPPILSPFHPLLARDLLRRLEASLY